MPQSRTRSTLAYPHVCWLALWAVVVLACLSSAPLAVSAKTPTPARLLACVGPAGAGVGPRASIPPCPPPAPPPGPSSSLAQCPTGTQYVSCQDALTALSGWYGWVLLAIGALGVLSLLLAFYQAIGATEATRGPTAWHLVFQRLISASVVFFVAWRLTPIATLVEAVLVAHTGDSDTGIAPLPTGALVALAGLLFALLMQGLLGWWLLRLALRTLEGIAAIGGHNPRSLGTTLRSVGGLAILGFGILVAPTVISWLAGLLTSGSF